MLVQMKWFALFKGEITEDCDSWMLHLKKKILYQFQPHLEQHIFSLGEGLLRFIHIMGHVSFQGHWGTVTC